MLASQMIDSGHLNAIAFWFDLHLDEDISITSAPALIGLGGEVLADVEGDVCPAGEAHQNPLRARGKSTLQNLGRPQEAAMQPPCSYTAEDGSQANYTPARVSPHGIALKDEMLVILILARWRRVFPHQPVSMRHLPQKLCSCAGLQRCKGRPCVPDWRIRPRLLH